jgi:hypothetical protein
VPIKLISSSKRTKGAGTPISPSKRTKGAGTPSGKEETLDLCKVHRYDPDEYDEYFNRDNVTCIWYAMPHHSVFGMEVLQRLLRTRHCIV